MTEEIETKKKISLFTEVVIFLIVAGICVVLLQQFILKKDFSFLISDKEQSHFFIDKPTNKDLEFENKAYVRNIKETYGITVYYGKGTEKENSKINGTTQYNAGIINNNLKQIYDALKKYPSEVFDMAKSKKYPVNIYLLDQFQNDNLALATRNNLNEFKIYVSNNASFERSFHHEMYHILEYYMADTHRYLYANWDSLNPEGFTYQTDISKLTDDYVYQEEKQLIDENQVSTSPDNTVATDKDPYFVTKYAKVSAKEDRAEIFAEMMIAKKKPSYLEIGKHVKQKADLIVKTIQEYVTKQSFYYEKFFS